MTKTAQILEDGEIIEPTEALTVRESFMPALTLEQAVERYNEFLRFKRTVMIREIDYGTIPGTKKDVLLLPGAEKICTLYGLSARFDCMSVTEDWDKPLFAYRYKCTLSRNGNIVAEGEGSCNSREKKYRYRDVGRTCPNCGQQKIIKGKRDYGGGWVCWSKDGTGCKAKFPDGDKSIEDQPSGQIENPEIFDLVNTIVKMAEKRALVAAAKLAGNASEFFSQDFEELVIDGDGMDEARKNRPSEEQIGAIDQAARAAGVDADDVAMQQYGMPVTELQAGQAQSLVGFIKSMPPKKERAPDTLNDEQYRTLNRMLNEANEPAATFKLFAKQFGVTTLRDLKRKFVIQATEWLDSVLEAEAQERKHHDNAELTSEEINFD